MKRKFSFNTQVNIVRYAGSLLLTFLFGAMIISMQGESPLAAVRYIFEGSFGNKVNLGNVLHWFASCAMVGFAASVAFKSGVMNLGLEGQLYMGAWISAILGYKLALPPVIHPLVCILAGMAAGLLWGLVPALMKLIFQVNEIITTLMMNFIAILLTDYLTVLFLDYEGITNVTVVKTPTIQKTAQLTVLIKGTSATTAILIAIVVGIVLHLLYHYTVKGYELKQVGENLRFAKMGGVNATQTFISIFLLTSMIAGMCGALEVLGVNHQFITSFSSNMGWDGVMIARVAVNNPLVVMAVSFFWAIFKAGSLYLERATELNRYVINLLQAMLVIFLSADYSMILNKYYAFVKRKKQRLEIKEGT